MTSKTYRIGTDIGGTFTDLVLLGSDGSFHTKKVLSTPPDYERGVLVGVEALLTEHGINPSAVERIGHATTIATNAVLERRGAKTGLITTKGFRDILEIRRLRFPDMYNLFWEKPAPLVDRYLRLEATERVAADGSIITPLDLSEVAIIIDRLVADGIAALSVCFLNSYANPVHEEMIGELVRRKYPDLPVSLSCRVLPEMREFERTSTTVLNSYLVPIMRQYLEALGEGLVDRDVQAPLFVMQSNGGMMTAREARNYPVYILESGPAAGVVGAVNLAASLGIANAVTFDMGGTTAKAAMIENGEPSLSSEYQVGAPISIASRVLKGGGYSVRAPTIDIAEVGAGGGSVVSIDQGGALRVGPRSAGAIPGPACYGNGGEEPTVTDANLLLGYLNPSALLGGSLAVDKSKAESAFSRIVWGTGLPLLEAAYGVYKIANATMMRAIRAVSSERGRDIRGCALVVFGGNGPVHAAEMARSLGMAKAIIPRGSGVFSALGLLRAHMERYFVDSCRLRIESFDPGKLASVFDLLANRALAELRQEGWSETEIELHRIADLRYQGQSFELQIPVPDVSREGTIEALAQAFHHEHKRTYGHSHDSDIIEVVNARIRARIPVRAPALPALDVTSRSGETKKRSAYFGPLCGVMETPVVARAELVGRMSGPLIIEEYDTTIIVPPGTSVQLDSGGNVVLDVGAAA